MVNILKFLGIKESEENLNEYNRNKLTTYRRIAKEIEYTHSILEKDQRPIIDQHLAISKESTLEKKISEFEVDLVRFEIHYNLAIKNHKNYWSAIGHAIDSTLHFKNITKKTRGYEILRLIQETTDNKLIIHRWNRKAFDEEEVRNYIIKLKEDNQTNKQILREVKEKYKHTMCINTMNSYLMSNILEQRRKVERKYDIVLN